MRACPRSTQVNECLLLELRPAGKASITCRASDQGRRRGFCRISREWNKKQRLCPVRTRGWGRLITFSLSLVGGVSRSAILICRLAGLKGGPFIMTRFIGCIVALTL